MLGSWRTGEKGKKENSSTESKNMSFNLSRGIERNQKTYGGGPGTAK